MKNDKYVESLNKIDPDEAKQERILHQILSRARSGKSQKDKVKMMNKTMKWLTPVAACLVIAVVAVFAVPKLTNNNSGIANPPAVSGTEQVSISQSPNVADNKININELANIPSGTGKNNIALMTDDFIEMSRQEIIDFYGVNFFLSEFPSDMKEVDELKFGIYKRNGGTGEVYYSGNGCAYFNNDCSREINIGVDKGELPFSDFGWGGTSEKSTISGTEMLLGHYTDSIYFDYYYAEFMHNKIGFRVITNHLTEAEFIAVIENLI